MMHKFDQICRPKRVSEVVAIAGCLFEEETVNLQSCFKQKDKALFSEWLVVQVCTAHLESMVFEQDEVPPPPPAWPPPEKRLCNAGIGLSFLQVEKHSTS